MGEMVVGGGVRVGVVGGKKMCFLSWLALSCGILISQGRQAELQHAKQVIHR